MPSCQSAVCTKRIGVALLPVGHRGMASVGPRTDKSADLARHVRGIRTVGAQTGYGGGVSASDRTLLLLRHAKSDYPDGVADHDRPLAPRGVREAGLAGDWIRTNAPAVDAVLCSTATRTRETLARTRIDAPTEFVDRLYDSTPGLTLDVINGLNTRFDFDVKTLLVVGHEPTTSELAHRPHRRWRSGRPRTDGAEVPDVSRRDASHGRAVGPAYAARRDAGRVPRAPIACLRSASCWC